MNEQMDKETNELKRMNLDTFYKNVLHRNVLDFYDSGISVSKEVTYVLKDKMGYHTLNSSTVRILKYF
jgi:hypothetical protein